MTGSAAGIELWWLPLGAGGHVVRWNGRIHDAQVARHEGRPTMDLYHSGLRVTLLPQT